MIAGIPVGLPVFFLPLVLNSYLLSVLLVGDRAGRVSRGALALALVLVVDLVLDPAAVALGFWAYDGGGVYYGVPLSNFGGWVLSGTVAVLAIEYAFDAAAVRDRLDDCAFALDDLVSFVLLWSGVNVVYAQWLPVAFAALLLAGLVRSQRFDTGVVRATAE
jgi:putative membrane protein